MTNEITDTSELEAFDDITKVTAEANPLARDVADLACVLSTLASITAETSRSLQCSTEIEQENILRRLIPIGRDAADGVHERMRCYEEILRKAKR